MKKRSITALLIVIVLSCTREDRDHLSFVDDIPSIERNIRAMDKIIMKLPPQKDSMMIQSYYFEIIEEDTTLFINSEKIGIISSTYTRKTLDSIFDSKDTAAQFINASRLLARNNIMNCLNDYCGWVYVYKYSADRGEYRPTIYDYPGRAKFMENCYRVQLIDRKGNILLFKENP